MPEPREPIKGRAEHASRPLVLEKIFLAQRLRDWTAPRTLSRICGRFHICLQSLFLHLCFSAVAIVFVLSLVLLPSLVFTVVWTGVVVLVFPTLSETSIRHHWLQ